MRRKALYGFLARLLPPSLTSQPHSLILRSVTSSPYACASLLVVIFCIIKNVMDTRRGRKKTADKSFFSLVYGAFAFAFRLKRRGRSVSGGSKAIENSEPLMSRASLLGCYQINTLHNNKESNNIIVDSNIDIEGFEDCNDSHDCVGRVEDVDVDGDNFDPFVY